MFALTARTRALCKCCVHSERTYLNHPCWPEIVPVNRTSPPLSTTAVDSALGKQTLGHKSASLSAVKFSSSSVARRATNTLMSSHIPCCPPRHPQQSLSSPACSPDPTHSNLRHLAAECGIEDTLLICFLSFIGKVCVFDCMRGVYVSPVHHRTKV